VTNALLMYILSVYIFKAGVNQQLYGRARWYWTQCLRAGAAVKFHQVELDSWH